MSVLKLFASIDELLSFEIAGKNSLVSGITPSGNDSIQRRIKTGG